MSTGVLLAALPVIACAACLPLRCRPGPRSCQPDPRQEKAELRDEITGLCARLAAGETELASRS